MKLLLSGANEKLGEQPLLSGCKGLYASKYSIPTTRESSLFEAISFGEKEKTDAIALFIYNETATSIPVSIAFASIFPLRCRYSFCAIDNGFYIPQIDLNSLPPYNTYQANSILSFCIATITALPSDGETITIEGKDIVCNGLDTIQKVIDAIIAAFSQNIDFAVFQESSNKLRIIALNAFLTRALDFDTIGTAFISGTFGGGVDNQKSLKSSLEKESAIALILIREYSRVEYTQKEQYDRLKRQEFLVEEKKKRTLLFSELQELNEISKNEDFFLFLY